MTTEIHIRAVFETRRFCLFSVLAQEPIGKQYSDYRVAIREREQIMHYVNGSTSPDWLRMCCELESEAA